MAACQGEGRAPTTASWPPRSTSEFSLRAGHSHSFTFGNMLPRKGLSNSRDRPAACMGQEESSAPQTEQPVSPQGPTDPLQGEPLPTRGGFLSVSLSMKGIRNRLTSESRKSRREPGEEDIALQHG